MTAPATVDPDELRAAFLALLTVDSKTKDRRRRDFNQAIFIPPGESFGAGKAVWSSIDLDMVLEKFDKAIRKVRA